MFAPPLRRVVVPIARQITPRATEALAVGGAEAKRAFDAMMDMRKIDVAVIKAAGLISTCRRILGRLR